MTHPVAFRDRERVQEIRPLQSVPSWSLEGAFDRPKIGRNFRSDANDGIDRWGTHSGEGGEDAEQESEHCGSVGQADCNIDGG